jgi:hypothetical protein
MEFEYDPAKSATNKDKHGIDFEEAKALWKDENRLSLPLLTEFEPRFLMVGLIGVKMWTAVCTKRESAVRIISVRRSRKIEAMRYEDQDFGSRA